MNLKQQLIIAIIQIAITFIIFPFIPLLVQELSGNIEFASKTAEVYRIIFAGGVITAVLLGIVIMGGSTIYEWAYIFSAELFLAIIFYQKYDTYLPLTLTFLAFGFAILLIRIPMRSFLVKNKIMAN